MNDPRAMDEGMSPPANGLTAPTAWPWAVGTRPVLCSETTSWRGALLRSWHGTSPVMVQPPLDHHYVVMHLGGAKRVHRAKEGPATTTIAESGSITIVPAGTAYRWKTEGPIAFAHLYLRPQDLARVCEESGDGDCRGVDLVDRVGIRDPFLEPAFRRMLAEVQEGPDLSRLILDSMLESVRVRLARSHMSGFRRGAMQRAESLAPHRLRRVVEFIDAHLGQDLALADLVSSAGTSQFHFSRAFRMATGESPYRYVLSRRIEYARLLLIAETGSLDEVSSACGFNSQRQFSVMFKRTLGIGPKRFRLLHQTKLRS